MNTLETATDYRLAMVRKLKAEGFIKTERVEHAMQNVPRHVFGHWLSLETVYGRGAFELPGATQNTMSTISDPAAVALMLEPLELQPGHRVLEIGAGTGYNAALIADIVGPSGHVTTVDIEPYVVTAAKTNLRATGFDHVEVILGDGGFGLGKNAPFDRITATVGVWEIPLEWFDQLAPNGKIAAPVHIAGEPHEHVYMVLEREGEHLDGRVTNFLNMVVMRGSSSATHTRQTDETGLGVEPKSIAVKVYRCTDPNAPVAKALEVHGNMARKVIEKKHTRIALEIEVATVISA